MKAHPLNKASSKRTPGRRKATFLAKYRPDVFLKEPRTIKTPLHRKISPPCIQNELILARYAPHVFKMPCKAPLKDTPSEDLAREGPFSLHGPLKSCTTGESCHPSLAASAGHMQPFNSPCTPRPRPDGFSWARSCRARWVLSRESRRPL